VLVVNEPSDKFSWEISPPDDRTMAEASLQQILPASPALKNIFTVNSPCRDVCAKIQPTEQVSVTDLTPNRVPLVHKAALEASTLHRESLSCHSVRDDPQCLLGTEKQHDSCKNASTPLKEPGAVDRITSFPSQLSRMGIQCNPNLDHSTVFSRTTVTGVFNPLASQIAEWEHSTVNTTFHPPLTSSPVFAVPLRPSTPCSVQTGE
jgi:hypothetical protein